LMLLLFAVFAAIATGTPWVSITHGFSLVKPGSKIVAGMILLLTSLIPIASMMTG
jgi:hypothetical protein